MWTWCAIDAGTKLVPSWAIGDRSAETAGKFIANLASRLARVQFTSDGHKSYLQAVEDAFGDDVDYAQLVKVYGPAAEPAGRYGPGECIGATKEPVIGKPDPKHISASYVERQNLRRCPTMSELGGRAEGRVRTGWIPARTRSG